eukprot:6447970-Prymnesium_polylepis.3
MAQCALTAVPPSRRLEIAVLVACGVAAALPRIGHRHECPPIVVAEPTHHREHHPARVQRRELPPPGGCVTRDRTNWRDERGFGSGWSDRVPRQGWRPGTGMLEWAG